MKCPRCGHTIPSGDRFCANCGQPLPQKPTKRNMLPILLAAVILLLVAASAAILLLYHFREKPSAAFDAASARQAAARFTDEDGFVDPDDVEDVLDAVYRAVKDAPGVIACYKEESLVLIDVDDGPDYIYSPTLRDVDEGEGALKIITFQPYYSTNLKSDPKLDHKALDACAERAARDANWSFVPSDDVDDENVNLDKLLHLDEYKLILWQGHGKLSEHIGFLLSIPISYEKAMKTNAVFNSGNVYRSTDNKVIFVGAQFFKDNYSRHSFDNAVMYFATCHSGEDDEFANVFLNMGAAAVFGNSGAIYRSYNLDMLHLIMESFLVGEDGFTVAPAIERLGPSAVPKVWDLASCLQLAQARYGKVDPNGDAVVRCFGNASLTYDDWMRTLRGTPVAPAPDKLAGSALRAYYDILSTNAWHAYFEDWLEPTGDYYISDIEGDGVPEMIISACTAIADGHALIYTYSPAANQAVLVADIDVQAYSAPSICHENQIIAFDGYHGGGTTGKYVLLNDGKVISEYYDDNMDEHIVYIEDIGPVVEGKYYQPAMYSVTDYAWLLNGKPAAETPIDRHRPDSYSPTVGVCQIISHPVLDALLSGFRAGVGAACMYDVDIEVQNANGDSNACESICEDFRDGKDLVLTVGSSALDAAVSSGLDVPVIGTAITDYTSILGLPPESLGSAPWDDIFVFVDFPSPACQVQMIQNFFPNARKVGILYCSCEPPAYAQMNLTKRTLEENGYEVQAFPFQSSADVRAVTQEACNFSDVIYIPIDNTAYSMASDIDAVCRAADVPVATSSEEIMKACGVCCIDVDYYDLGYQAGLFAGQMLNRWGMAFPGEAFYCEHYNYYYSPDRCSSLGLTPPADYVPLK